MVSIDTKYCAVKGYTIHLPMLHDEDLEVFIFRFWALCLLLPGGQGFLPGFPRLLGCVLVVFQVLRFFPTSFSPSNVLAMPKYVHIYNKTPAK